ncbi:MAG: HD domain-containing protein [Nanoarchaeota archaeon]
MDEGVLEFLKDLDSKNQHNIFKLLKNDEIELLHNLSKHDAPTVVHSFNVASDCVFVAEMLGLSKTEIRNIRIAALLHDVGKVNMLAVLLDYGVDKDELHTIAVNRPIVYSDGEDLRRKVLMWEIIEHRSHLSVFDKKYISRTQAKKLMAMLGSQAYLTLWEHIKNHQYYTEKLLDPLDLPDEIKHIASNHHPEYKDMPHCKIEIAIVSAVDKFNAMIHSEGIRYQEKKKERSEALTVLVDQLHLDYNVVKALGKRHLRIEEQSLKKAVSEMVRRFLHGTSVEQAEALTLIKKIAMWLRATKRLHLYAIERWKVKRELDELKNSFRLAYGN